MVGNIPLPYGCQFYLMHSWCRVINIYLCVWTYIHERGTGGKYNVQKDSPVVLPDAYRDSTAWIATYMAGTLNVSNIIWNSEFENLQDLHFKVAEETVHFLSFFLMNTTSFCSWAPFWTAVLLWTTSYVVFRISLKMTEVSGYLSINLGLGQIFIDNTNWRWHRGITFLSWCQNCNNTAI